MTRRLIDVHHTDGAWRATYEVPCVEMVALHVMGEEFPRKYIPVPGMTLMVTEVTAEEAVALVATIPTRL